MECYYHYQRLQYSVLIYQRKFYFKYLPFRKVQNRLLKHDSVFVDIFIVYLHAEFHIPRHNQ